MSANDQQALIQWREASLWLAKAEADILGARTLLAGGQAELAAFHVQQALEKTLKALLVAAAQDVRRIHDIDALASLAPAHWPDLLPSPFPLAAVSQWYVTTRYPGLDAPPPPDRGGCRGIGGGRHLDRRRGAAFPAGSCHRGWTGRRIEPLSAGGRHP